MKKKVFSIFILIVSLLNAAAEYESQTQNVRLIQPDYYYQQEVTNTIPTNSIQGVIIGKRLADQGSSLDKYYNNTIVITAADIKRTGAKTIPEVLQTYAGIPKYSNGTGSDLAWTLAWHGFNQGEEVVVVVDGVKINDPDGNQIYWSNLPVENIESIEIIPGSLSAQYGSGVFAGIINIVTNKKFAKELVFSIGNYGLGRQKFSFGEYFDNLYYGFSIDNSGSTGYRNHSGYQDQRLTLKTGYFDQDQQLDVNYKRALANLHYPVQLTESELTDSRTQSPQHNTQVLENYLFNLEYKRKIQDFNLALNIGQGEAQSEYTNISKTNPASDVFLIDYAKSNNFLIQLNYLNKIVLGYDYRRSNIEADSWSYDRYQLKTIDKTAAYIATKGEYAPYFQYFEQIGPLYFRYGVREDKTDYVNYDNLNKTREDKNFNQRTHNGEIGWSLTPELTGYFSYGEAFKAPTFSDLFRSINIWYLANSNLTAEKAKTNTGGLKYKNRDFEIDWSVFRTIVDDEIIFVADPMTFQSQNQNAQKTGRDGFDLRLNEKINDSLQFFGNYNYTKARFLDYQDGWGGDYAGYAIPLVPAQTYSLGFNYIFEKYRFYFVHNFVGAQYLGDDLYNEENKLPAYNFSNFKVDYEFTEQVAVFLKIDNLFNNLYATKGLKWFNTLTFQWDKVYTPADLRSYELGCKILF